MLTGSMNAGTTFQRVQSTKEQWCLLKYDTVCCGTVKPIFQKPAASGKNASSSMLLMTVAHAYETVTIYQTTMQLNSTDCSASTSWHKIISRPNSKSATVNAAYITTITAAALELQHHLKQNGRWEKKSLEVFYIYLCTAIQNTL